MFLKKLVPGIAELTRQTIEPRGHRSYRTHTDLSLIIVPAVEILGHCLLKGRLGHHWKKADSLITIQCSPYAHYNLGPSKHGLVTNIQVNVYIGNTLSRLSFQN